MHILRIPMLLLICIYKIIKGLSIIDVRGQEAREDRNGKVVVNSFWMSTSQVF